MSTKMSALFGFFCIVDGLFPENGPRRFFGRDVPVPDFWQKLA